MVVKNRDESHGIESVKKNHQLSKQTFHRLFVFLFFFVTYRPPSPKRLSFSKTSTPVFRGDSFRGIFHRELRVIFLGAVSSDFFRAEKVTSMDDQFRSRMAYVFFESL